jgi:hypothetical protein
LVSSRSEWHAKMAKWINKAWEANQGLADDDGKDSVVLAVAPSRIRVVKPKPLTLLVLFGTATKCMNRVPAVVLSEEETQMETLANILEDSFPDNGAIEVPSDEEYQP